jgi:hypothetical protein
MTTDARKLAIPQKMKDTQTTKTDLQAIILFVL